MISKILAKKINLQIDELPAYNEGDTFISATYSGTKTNLISADVATPKMLNIRIGETIETIDQFGVYTEIVRQSRKRCDVSKIITGSWYNMDKWKDPDGRVFSDVNLGSILQKFER